MENLEESLSYLEINENDDDISYVKIGENSKNIVVSFSSAYVDHYERKRSLLEPKFIEKKNYDVLYIKNQFSWYLGGLKGIGKNITHTISFLKKEISNYDNKLFTGFSMGGYASLLFGNICNVTATVSIEPQTNLDFLMHCKSPDLSKIKQRKRDCIKTYDKYKNIKNYINDNVENFVYFEGDENIMKTDRGLKTKLDLAYHGDVHYENIKEYNNVRRVEERTHVKPLILSLIENGV